MKNIVKNPHQFLPARYEHDCANCAYVGQTGRYDLYACPSKAGLEYVARYGSNGPDYLSAAEPISAIKWPLSVAVAMARILEVAS